MNKLDNKIICIILICIIVLSTILIKKITSDKKYDEELYAQIYSEYNEIFENNISDYEQNKEDKPTNIVSNANSFATKQEETKIEQKEIQRNKVIASIMIPKLTITYPVIEETTDE